MAAATRAAFSQGADGNDGRKRELSLSSCRLRGWLLVVCLFVAAEPAAAASNKVRITGLSDVAFGTVANLTADAVQSQSVCLYADTATNGYNVAAAGSGPGGSFQMSSGSQTMTYDVQWSALANRNSGSQLDPNVPLGGLASAASHQTCANGPATSASLIIVLRSAALSNATAGTYSGTLTLLVGPE